MSYKPVGQGRRARVFDFNGLRFTESLHPPHGALPWHAHQRGCMTLLLGGAMQERFPSTDVDCRRDGLLIKPPEARHATRFGPEGARCMIIECTGVAGFAMRPNESLFDRVTYRKIAGGLTRQIVAELAGRDSSSDIILEGFVLQLIGQTQRSHCQSASHAGSPGWLSTVHDRVRAEFRSKLSVSELASSVGVHPDHLGRAFRKRYGLPIGDLLRELRLSWAAEQITQTDADLSTIAVQAGFCDQSHMSGAFRRRFGITPGRFRANR